MTIFGTKDSVYITWRSRQRANIYNGAHYYGEEIENIILPSIETDVFIVTAGGTLQPRKIPNGAAFVCHHNQNPEETYKRFFNKGILWICSKESTMGKIKACGETAVFIPLSIDTEYVKTFRTKKTEDTAFVGNAWNFKREYLASLPKDIVQLGNMERGDLLREMSKFKRIIAEGRCNMEAQVLGCEVELPDYKDSSIDVVHREVLDSRDAIPLWREVLTEFSEKTGILSS